MVQFSTPVSRISFLSSAIKLTACFWQTSYTLLFPQGWWRLMQWWKWWWKLERDGLKGSYDLCSQYASLSRACVRKKVMNTCFFQYWLKHLHVVCLGQKWWYQDIDLHSSFVHNTLHSSCVQIKTFSLLFFYKPFLKVSKCLTKNNMRVGEGGRVEINENQVVSLSVHKYI